MYTFAASQPIFNKKRHTVGYELLFRDGERNAFPQNVNEDRATYRLITENFITLGRNTNNHSSRCFINFPYKSLIQQLPLSLPKEKIVVEVLESCEPNDELYSAIRDLSRQGYVIALDDFLCTKEWERFIPYVHIIKLDIRQMGIGKACSYVQQQKQKGVKTAFLAEKVESHNEFDLALKSGFKYFQGYFFSKPNIIRKKHVSPEQLIVIELFTEVCRPEVNFNRIEGIFGKNASLSYKLLRFVNSTSDQLKWPITSLQQALVYLGEDKLKTFVSLIAASYMTSRKTDELNILSMQRARFCQLMSDYSLFRPHKHQAFIIGMFSLLDAMFDNSLDILLEALPLSNVVKSALLKREGSLGQLLMLHENYEHSDWQKFQLQCNKLGLHVKEVCKAAIEAQTWSRNIFRVMVGD